MDVIAPEVTAGPRLHGRARVVDRGAGGLLGIDRLVELALGVGGGRFGLGERGLGPLERGRRLVPRRLGPMAGLDRRRVHAVGLDEGLLAAGGFGARRPLLGGRRLRLRRGVVRPSRPRLRRLRRWPSPPRSASGRDGAGCRSANSSLGAASPEPRIPATSWAAPTSLAATCDSRALISPAAAWRPTPARAASASRTRSALRSRRSRSAVRMSGPSRPSIAAAWASRTWAAASTKPATTSGSEVATAFSDQSSQPGRRSAATAVASSRALSLRSALTTSLRAATKSGGGVAKSSRSSVSFRPATVPPRRRAPPP